MDTPSGIFSARVAGLATRNKKLSAVPRWVGVACALAGLVCVAASVAAQDEIVPEPAVIAPLAPTSLALDAVVVDGAVVVVGDRGHILISTDAAVSWHQQEVPVRASLTGVFFIDRNHGWAVGHDSVILRTVDGGSTWEIVNWDPEAEAPFFDVWFSDDDNGIAIGAYGSYFTTADGGTTWTQEVVDEDEWHLHQIASAEDGRLYIAAEAGMIYRSDDGGVTWTDLPSPYVGSFFGVLPLDEEVVLLFGLRGNLFRSEDAGETWEQLETETVAMLNDGVVLPDGRIVIAGLGGTLLISDDDGRTFEVHQQESRRGIQKVVVVNDDSLLLVGEFGVRLQPINELESTGGAGQ